MEFENFQSVQESKNYSDSGMYVDLSRFNDLANFEVFLLKPFNSLARNFNAPDFSQEKSKSTFTYISKPYST